MLQTELLHRVRKNIYDRIARTGLAPTVEEVATLEAFDVSVVKDAFKNLAESHVVVLKPGTVELWSAPPFSAVPTSFRVHGVAASWYAPCAWDMFGVPAALKEDAILEAQCAWSREPLPSTVRGGEVAGTGVVHLEVPARHFWDDIFYTWANILLFRSEEDVERWCHARGVDRGATMTIEQAWLLSRRWYGSRLDPDFRRPTVDEAHAIFDSVGLTGDFWRLS